MEVDAAGTDAAADQEPAMNVDETPGAQDERVVPVAGPSERRAQVVLPEQVEDEGPTYFRMGVDHELDPEEEEIHIQCGRVRKIENLEAAGAKLKRLLLIANCIDKIENLDTNVNLEHLELYQNQLKKIENIKHLTNLVVLDLSFNKIRRIDNLGPYNQLQRLYLSSNKIDVVENIFELRALKMLELGSNRIRGIPPELGNLVELEELWLGRNKIVNMALPPLPKLRHLSMQSNRLETWDAALFRNCPGLTHLYLGQNNLPDVIAEIQELKELQELDLAKNAIDHVVPLPELRKLRDLWMNDNQIGSLDEFRNLASMPALTTVYLERNPCHGLGDKPSEERYKAAIMEALPRLQQLDANHLYDKVKVITDGTEHKLRGIRKA